MIGSWVVSSFLCTAALSAAIDADYVIRGAMIYVGENTAGVQGDVAIRGDRVVAVGMFEIAGKPRTLDGKGLMVAPGFIDLHNHSDRPITQAITRANINFLMQGVTTIVTGNCGGGAVDVADYFKRIDEYGAGTNVVHLIPHGDLRSQVMGSASRPPTVDELEKMKQLADQAMSDGAWGMSSGLIYVPSSFATTDELAELMKVVGRRGGLYATHMRNENTQIIEAIQETLEIGRRANVPVHISHFKVSGPHAWGMAADAVELVKEARARGQMVTADQYPYTASSTSLAAMTIPARYRDRKKLVAVLEDPQEGPKIRQQIQQSIEERGNGTRLFVASYEKNRGWQGKNLADVAKSQGKAVLDLVLEIQQNGGASMVNFGMSEEEVRLIMQQSFVATASDGSAKDPSDGEIPHPRSYGCFPRKIGRYAIEGKTVSIEQAIRSATGLPADILKLSERGYLKEGYYADIVVFDPRTFRDNATYEKPHQHAAGVRYLFVNGRLAIDDGQYTGALSGKALRHRSG